MTRQTLIRYEEELRQSDPPLLESEYWWLVEEHLKLMYQHHEACMVLRRFGVKVKG